MHLPLEFIETLFLNLVDASLLLPLSCVEDEFRV
jgi:hypothetical protein